MLIEGVMKCKHDHEYYESEVFLISRLKKSGKQKLEVIHMAKWIFVYENMDKKNKV